jgi:hypothetical protein
VGVVTPEGRVKKKVKALLTENKAYQFWPVQTGFGAPTLDCIGCHEGEYYAVETKAPGQHMTPRQELSKRDMEAAQGVVFVIGETQDELGEYSGMEDLRRWLKRGKRLRAA